MMKKITKKELINRLTGTDFIGAYWNVDDGVIFGSLHELDKIKPIYRVEKIVQRSNFIDCYKDEGDSSRRDFDHRNKYFVVGNYLIHKNYGDDWNCWMVNRTVAGA